MKISIIGYNGAGKSTLAKQLALKHGIPYLFLDTVHFNENWQERPLERILNDVDSFMKNKSWIIDGNYKSFRQHERFLQADYIIFLDYPMIFCFVSAFNRYLKHKNKTRESMAKGCNEKFDWEFITWLLHDGRTNERRQAYKNTIDKYSQKMIVAKNRKELYMILKEKNLL